MYMPRPDETESSERLDALLTDLREADAPGRRDLVAAHVGSLFAGIETPPEHGAWPFGPLAQSVSPRWVQAVVGYEIDRMILRMVDNEPFCVDCLIAWVRHLVEARVAASEWAWARDARELLE